jgi:hypothetical protein
MCHTSHLTLLQDGLCHEVSSDDRDCHGLRGVLYNGTNQVLCFSIPRGMRYLPGLGAPLPPPLYPPEPHPCRLPNKRRAIKLANALALQLLPAPHATRLHARPSSLQLRLRVKCTPRSPCDDAQVLPLSSCSGSGHARLCRPLVAALSYCKAALYATTHCSACQP